MISHPSSGETYSLIQCYFSVEHFVTLLLYQLYSNIYTNRRRKRSYVRPIIGLSGRVFRSSSSNESSFETNHQFGHTCSLLGVDVGSLISVLNLLLIAVAFSSHQTIPKHCFLHPLESVQRELLTKW